MPDPKNNDARFVVATWEKVDGDRALAQRGNLTWASAQELVRDLIRQGKLPLLKMQGAPKFVEVRNEKDLQSAYSGSAAGGQSPDAPDQSTGAVAAASADDQSAEAVEATDDRQDTRRTVAEATPAPTSTSTAAPLWTKVIYGFYDEHDQWQQSNPLTWEEAGHQIAASIYLGRHPFVWDGGMRLWRPLVTEPEHAAKAVHSTLAGSGWSPEQRAAVLGGPDAWRRHSQSGRGHTDHIVSIDPKKIDV